MPSSSLGTVRHGQEVREAVACWLHVGMGQVKDAGPVCKAMTRTEHDPTDAVTEDSATRRYLCR